MNFLPKEIEDLILYYKTELEKINQYKKYINKSIINRNIKSYEKEQRKEYIILPINSKKNNMKKLIYIFLCKKYLLKDKYSLKLKTNINNEFNRLNIDFEKKYFDKINYIVLDNYEQYYIIKILNMNYKKIYYKNNILKLFLDYIK